MDVKGIKQQTKSVKEKIAELDAQMEQFPDLRKKLIQNYQKEKEVREQERNHRNWVEKIEQQYI